MVMKEKQHLLFTFYGEMFSEIGADERATCISPTSNTTSSHIAIPNPNPPSSLQQNQRWLSTSFDPSDRYRSLRNLEFQNQILHPSGLSFECADGQASEAINFGRTICAPGFLPVDGEWASTIQPGQHQRRGDREMSINNHQPRRGRPQLKQHFQQQVSTMMGSWDVEKCCFLCHGTMY